MFTFNIKCGIIKWDTIFCERLIMTLFFNIQNDERLIMSCYILYFRPNKRVISYTLLYITTYFPYQIFSRCDIDVIFLVVNINNTM